jgi:ribosomal silencing factor RsfS
VIHLFDEQMRQYYDLEELWAGSTRVELPADIAGPRIAS